MIKEEICHTSSSPCDGCSKSDCESSDEKGVSQFKIIASHGITLFAILMFKCTYGFSIGLTTILLPILYRPDAEIYVTRDQLTWFSSYYFLQPVGAVFGGFLAQFIGCRMLLLIATSLYVTCGLIFYWSTNAAMFLSAQALVGFVSGMQKGPSFTFVAEISLPRFRSILMGCAGISLLFGTFMATTLGTYLYWRTLFIINLAFPITGSILIFFIPESPYWLASKNRYQDAAKSLAWFRGWTNPDNVKNEFHLIMSKSDTSSSAAEIKRTTISSTERFNRLKEMSMQTLKRSFYIPFLTVIFVFAVNNFNGTPGFTTFSVLIFEKIGSPVDPNEATIALSALRVIAAIFSVILVNIAGKRKLLLITMLCCNVFLIICATITYLTSINKLTGAAYHWIAMISFMLIDFCNCLGIFKISIFLNSELFPLHLRHIGVGVGLFANSAFNSIMNKVFLDIVEGATISGAFLCLAIVDIVGLVGIYFIVPETEGKTLKEIEDHYESMGTLRKIK